MPPKNEHFSRAHSLALSDISAWGSSDPFDWQDDFVNPFLDESEVGHLTPSNSEVGGYSHPAAAAPAASSSDSPRNMVRNVSSDEDRENYGQLGEMYAFSPNHDHDNYYDNHYGHDNDDDAYDGYNDRYHHNNYSSIWDFIQEMKLMMDDVHPEDDLTYPSKELRNGTETTSTTLLLPWRGGTLQRRYGSNGTVKSNSNHRSSHWSLSIGDMLNERQ